MENIFMQKDLLGRLRGSEAGESTMTVYWKA